MKKFTQTIKAICLFMIFKASFLGNANAQVLYHEGFEGDTLAGKIRNFSASKWELLPGGFNSYKGDVCAYVTTDSYNEKADCWLITNKLHFKAGKKYSISFYYKCQTNQDNQLQVSISNNLIAPESDIVWDKNFHNDSYLKGQVNFTPSASGNEYVSFHCVTSPNMQTYLYLDEITVEEVSCFEPLNIAFTNTTSTSTIAGWDKVDGAEYYEYSILENDTSNPRKIFKVSNNSVTLKNLPVASSDYLYVRSRCSATDSSNWAAAKYSTNYDCSTFETLNCGVKIKKNYRGGTGLYPVKLCDQYINGPEFFHKFTATQNGYYKLNCFSSGGNGIPVSFSYKPSSDGCGNSNWNCIGVMGDYNTAIFGPLKAGEEYIIMEKSELEAKLPSTYTFEIECYNQPPANDDYKNATEITVSDYSEKCTGTRLTTTGATPDNLGPNDYNSCGAYANSNDDDIWIKFKATDNVQLFRFSNVAYTDRGHFLEVNFYSSPNNPDSLIDCGEVKTGDRNKDIISYYFTKGKTYWCRLSTIGIGNAASFSLCIMKPAIATSSADTCKQGLRLPSQDKDKNVWVPMLDQSLQLIGEVNFGDNTGSSTLPFVFINHGDLRQDETGRYYLDRNFNVLSRPKIKAPITVRLYLSNKELNKLADQKGSHVNGIKDIRVTQVDDGMCSPLESKTGTFIVPDKTGDYDANNKYIEFKTDQLSSFFLHGGSTALNSNSALTSNATASVLNGTLKVSPNPFTNIINIETNEHTSAEYIVSVITMNGQVLVKYKKIVSPGKSYLSLNLSTLSAGVYTLKIDKQSGTEFRKIVKQ